MVLNKIKWSSPFKVVFAEWVGGWVGGPVVTHGVTHTFCTRPNEYLRQ